MGETLSVSEVFGPTIQGEGPHAGRRCGFLRLALCNLNCSWCDTPFTWDWKGQNGVAYDRATEIHTRYFEEVWADIERLGVQLLVVTGGEPLVQGAKLARFLEQYVPAEMHIDVETNGTFSPLPLASEVDHWSVSPKLKNSGVPSDKAWNEQALRDFLALARGEHNARCTVAFKFVVRDTMDLAEIEWLRRVTDMPAEMVWLMPEGRKPEELAKHAAAVVESALVLGYNVTGRMHIELWGDERGH